MKKAALEAKMYLKNTGSITFDPLADIEKQNIVIAVSFDGSWGSPLFLPTQMQMIYIFP